ncbi:MAG TPA: Ig-like domain-containing protein [Thermomicrobiales bacterium]|nr:Ig-like domain-containing protein [Thermomicrobiales bacterium]
MGEAGKSSRLASMLSRISLAAALILPMLATLPASAGPPGHPHFHRTWERTDRPVLDQTARRTWMWGPAAFSDELPETYLEAARGSRTVQYYDKSRMEITDPAGDVSSPWFVTNGLLVVELVTGRLQVGNNVFVPLPAAAVSVAGDPDDLSGPTYATIATVLDAPAAPPGASYAERLSRDGTIVRDPALAARDVRVALVDDVTRHAIAAPFWAFMTSSGAVWDGGGIVDNPLFENPYYATGRPISEAYWATVRVGGTPHDVLLQCFERRCLTYTPDNPDGWQVEAGNVGRHYFTWRYEAGLEFTVAWVDALSGGDVAHGETVSLQIPPSALANAAIVSVVPAVASGTLDGFLPTGRAWRVDVDREPLLSPVTLSLGIDTSSLSADVDPAGAVLAFFDEEAGRWVAVPTILDAGARRATTTTTHLSIWQLFMPTRDDGGDPPPAPTPPPGPSPAPSPAPNSAPIVDLNGPDTPGNDGALLTRAGGDPIRVAPMATISDPDSETLMSVTIELLGATNGERESIAATAAPSVVVSRDSSGQRLQLSGPAGIGVMQDVLRSLTYQHDGGQVTSGARRIVVRASDASTTGPAATVIVTVAANQTPAAGDARAATDEDTSLPLTLVATDPDGDALTWSIDTEPGHGTLAGIAPALTYVPATNFHGVDQFAWSVNDGHGGVATALVTIDVRPVNDPPVAFAASFETDEDVAIAITLAGSDIDGDDLSSSVLSEPAHGTLSGVAPDLTYTPTLDYSGMDSFTFAVSDGIETSAVAAVTILVRPVNDPPVAGAQQIETDEDVPLAIVLAATDDGEDLVFVIVDGPRHGTLSGGAPHLIYAPDPDFHGSDSFTFTASDGEYHSATATVSIVVNPVNDRPTASSQSITVLEDGEVFFTVTGADVDGDAVRFNFTRMPTLGVIAIDGEWTCVTGSMPRVCSHVVYYAPFADLNGTDSFEFTVTDGKLTSAPATVSITIVPVNDPPVARDDSVTTTEDARDVVIDLLGNDSTAPDVGETLEIISVESFSHGGSALIVDGIVFYTPAPDFYGTETFRYTISDGNGGSATATVTITILPVNDPPVANDDAVEIDEDAGPVVIDALANDSFAPDVGETLTIAVVGVATLGVAEIMPGGAAIRYTPALNVNGVDTFTYTIADDGGLTATATVTVTIAAINDPPTVATPAGTLMWVEDDAPLAIVPGLAVDDVDSDIVGATVAFGSRPDGAAEVLSVVVGYPAIVATVDAATGTVTLAGGATSAEYQSALRSIHYVNLSQAPTAGDRVVTITVSDGELVASATVVIEVVPVNDPPVLVFGGIVGPGVGPVVLDVTATLIDVDSFDFDGGQLSATITGGYDDGDTLLVRPDGPLGVAGSLLTWDDGGGAVVIGTAEISERLLVVTFNAAATPARVQAVVRALAFQTISSSTGDRLVSVVVSDGDGGGSETGIVTVGVNRPPDAITLSSTAIPEDAAEGDVVGIITGSDPDGDTLTFELVSGSDPRFGIVLSNGAWLLRVAAGAAFDHETEPDVALTIRASDPAGRIYQETFTIAIADVNEPPTLIAPSSIQIAENSVVGSIVGVVGVTDPDAGQHHAFSITAENDAGAFVIDAATGTITVADNAPLDFETTPTFHLVVTVTDDGTPPLSATATITIQLTDVPEGGVDVEPPVVENLTYDGLVGNLLLRAGTSDGLLSTASDPEGSTLSIVSAEPYGGSAFGSLVWQPDGSFTWDPPAGAKYTAGTWQITVTDTAGHETTGLVTFELTNKRVLFVDNTYAGSTQNGHRSTPYTTLAAAASGSGIGDIIYLAASSVSYTGGVALKTNVTLVGAGAVGDDMRSVVGLPPLSRGAQEYPAINGVKPIITNASGPGLDLASGNTIVGLTLGATRGVALSGNGGGVQAGPTVRDVDIVGAGSKVGAAIQLSRYVGGSLTFDTIQRELTNSTGAQAVVDLAQMPTTELVVTGLFSATSSIGGGLRLHDAGSVELRGPVAITTDGFRGIHVSSTALRLTGVNNRSVVTTGSEFAIFVRNGATFTVANGDLFVEATGANALDVYGSTIEMTGAGSVIKATNGVGLIMRDATIGPAGVAIEAVFATGAENGVVVGLVGGDGALIIGPDAPDSVFGDGGVIVGTTGSAVLLQNAPQVTLRHLVIGADDAVVGEAASAVDAVAGIGIDAGWVSGLTLDHVKIARTGSHGIAGVEVADFSMTRSEILNAGDGPGEHGLWFDGPARGGENGMTGVALIADSVIDGFWDTGLVVRNVPSEATALDLTVEGTTFSGNKRAGGGVYLRAEGLTTIDARIDSCAFERLTGPTVDALAVGTGVLNLINQ